MSVHKIIFSLSLLPLLFSCSENNRGTDIDVQKKFSDNEQIVIKLNGFPSVSTISANRFPKFYPSQMFDKKSFKGESIFNEIKNDEIPYSLLFDFLPAPYVEEITAPKGYLSFTNALIKAMKSAEWDVFNNNKTTKSEILSYGVYSSSDAAKLFLKDISLYELLDKGDKKYIFLAKIISTKFDILCDIDLKERDDILYVSSISFGRYAYIAIPTDNPEDIIDLFKNGILKKDVNYIDKYIDISKSITILEKGGKDLGLGYWGENGFYNIVNVFDTYSDYLGVPICFEVKDPITNEVIH
ncbi:hypothetical protein BN938_2656 [Mucinivorans hirudinis]|uniref:Lipoprotein n=1 Tax=Mucinivorans hirudinis TaxID=1433126 RepID=A0A060RAQ2_9BACT|nr:hypothetical protein BN938_2656 [Mucinivorans hirudinis]